MGLSPSRIAIVVSFAPSCVVCDVCLHHHVVCAMFRCLVVISAGTFAGHAVLSDGCGS